MVSMTEKRVAMPIENSVTFMVNPLITKNIKAEKTPKRIVYLRLALAEVPAFS